MITTSRPTDAAEVALPHRQPGLRAKHLLNAAVIVATGAIAYLVLTNTTGENGQIALLVCIWTVAVAGLNIVQGLGGYPCLAQAAFFGGGAYVSSLLLHRGLPMVAAAAIAVLTTSAIGLVVGVVFGRTRGQYFAIGTLFLAAVVNLVLNNEVDITGGPNGLPVDLGWDPDLTLKLLAASVSLALALFYWTRESRLGSRLLSVREDEDLAEHLGVPTSRTKLVALTLSAALGGSAGVLLAQCNGVIAPSQFTFLQGFLMFVAVGIGGYGRLLTPVVGCILVVGLPQILNLGPGTSQIGLGAIFIAITLLMPAGVIGGVEHLANRLIRFTSSSQRAHVR